MSDTGAEVHSVLASIHAAWRGGHPSSMVEFLHPEIVVVPPGFKGTVRGRDILVSSFEEFSKNAKVLEYEESDEQIDAIDNCAIASFHFRMLYERAAYREDCSGRDLWVFARQDGRWIAVWRAMLELQADRSPIESGETAAAA